jgi:hypothetical protein
MSLAQKMMRRWDGKEGRKVLQVEELPSVICVMHITLLSAITCSRPYVRLRMTSSSTAPPRDSAGTTTSLPPSRGLTSSPPPPHPWRGGRTPCARLRAPCTLPRISLWEYTGGKDITGSAFTPVCVTKREVSRPPGVIRRSYLTHNLYLLPLRPRSWIRRRSSTPKSRPSSWRETRRWLGVIT